MEPIRDSVPIYGSSLVLDTPEAYAKEALEYKGRGFNAYKLHPPGDYDFDLEAHKAVRKAVGFYSGNIKTLLKYGNKKDS